MMSVKEACKKSIQKLTACADKCEQYVKALVPKLHCVQSAKDVVAASKEVIAACREHIKNCKIPACITACQACIKSSEKAVEKNTACIDVCMGAGSDNDAKIVCKDCADACKACAKNCQECVKIVCS